MISAVRAAADLFLKGVICGSKCKRAGGEDSTDSHDGGEAMKKPAWINQVGFFGSEIAVSSV